MKLFKKVAAAVLAGVMALSMVACAPTTDPTTPTPEVTPDSSTVATVLKWMNSQRVYDNEHLNDDNVTEEDLTEKKLIVNDTALAAKAEKILAVIAANKKAEVQMSANGKNVLVTKSAINLAVNGIPSMKLIGETDLDDVVVYTGDYKFDGIAQYGYKFPVDGLIFEDSKEERAALRDFGDALEDDLKNAVSDKDQKVGIASAKVGNFTYVLIITENI